MATYMRQQNCTKRGTNQYLFDFGFASTQDLRARGLPGSPSQVDVFIFGSPQDEHSVKHFGRNPSKQTFDNKGIPLILRDQDLTNGKIPLPVQDWIQAQVPGPHTFSVIVGARSVDSFGVVKFREDCKSIPLQELHLIQTSIQFKSTDLLLSVEATPAEPDAPAAPVIADADGIAIEETIEEKIKRLDDSVERAISHMCQEDSDLAMLIRLCKGTHCAVRRDHQSETRGIEGKLWVGSSYSENRLIGLSMANGYWNKFYIERGYYPRLSSSGIVVAEPGQSLHESREVIVIPSEAVRQRSRKAQDFQSAASVDLTIKVAKDFSILKSSDDPESVDYPSPTIGSRLTEDCRRWIFNFALEHVENWSTASSVPFSFEMVALGLVPPTKDCTCQPDPQGRPWKFNSELKVIVKNSDETEMVLPDPQRNSAWSNILRRCRDIWNNEELERKEKGLPYLIRRYFKDYDEIDDFEIDNLNSNSICTGNHQKRTFILPRQRRRSNGGALICKECRDEEDELNKKGIERQECNQIKKDGNKCKNSRSLIARPTGDKHSDSFDDEGFFICRNCYELKGYLDRKAKVEAEEIASLVNSDSSIKRCSNDDKIIKQTGKANQNRRSSAGKLICIDCRKREDLEGKIQECVGIKNGKKCTTQSVPTRTVNNHYNDEGFWLCQPCYKALNEARKEAKATALSAEIQSDQNQVGQSSGGTSRGAGSTSRARGGSSLRGEAGSLMRGSSPSRGRGVSRGASRGARSSIANAPETEGEGTSVDETSREDGNSVESNRGGTSSRATSSRGRGGRGRGAVRGARASTGSSLEEVEDADTSGGRSRGTARTRLRDSI